MTIGALIYRAMAEISSDQLHKSTSYTKLHKKPCPVKCIRALQRLWWVSQPRSHLLLPASWPDGIPAPLGLGLGPAGSRDRRGCCWASPRAPAGREQAGWDSLEEACPTAPSAVPILWRNPKCQPERLGWGMAAFGEQSARNTDPGRPEEGAKPRLTRKKWPPRSGDGVTWIFF